MRTVALTASLAAAVLLAVACSSTGSALPEATPGSSGGASGSAGSAGDAGAAGEDMGLSLRLEPAEAVLDFEQGEDRLAYRVFSRDESGAEVEVTNEASFFATPGHLFEGSTIVLTKGSEGQISVGAKFQGQTGKARLLVAKKVFSPGTPADASSRFQTPASADAPGPELVYPPSGILVPPNMNSLEIHFVPASKQSLFELRLLSPKSTLVAYFGCESLQEGCVYTPDKAFWSSLADQARGLGPVSYELREASPDGSLPVTVSQKATIEFAAEDIVGGLYYWNAGAGIVQRYDFGYPGQQAENYMTAANAGAGFCVGCHVLSRDGTRIAVGLDIPAPSVFKVFDVATKTMKFSKGSLFPGDTNGANFFSFSPDAKQIMTSDGNRISLRDGETGDPIVDPLVPQGTMPDWSPQGDLLVYARPSSPIGIAAPGISSGSIELLSFDGTAWGNPKTLAPFQGQNNYYPSFSPDQGWVVFNRSPSNRDSMANSSSDGGLPDGQIWAVSPTSGAPIRLVNASPNGDGDQWAKWSPNVMTYAGGNVMWITFTSFRSYGLRLGKGAQAQLWMAAFDPARAAAGEDPSFPAFWMPFQDIGSGNHIAQWVSKIVRKGCQEQKECEASERCDGGYCVPDIK